MAYTKVGSVELPFSANLTISALRTAVGNLDQMSVTDSDTRRLCFTSTGGNTWGEKIVLTLIETVQGNAVVEFGSANKLGPGWKLFHSAVERVLTQAQSYLLNAFLKVEAKGAGYAFMGTLVGGYNTEMPPGTAVVFAFGSTGIYVCTGGMLYSWPATQVESVTAGGPGVQSTGGAWIGGGFGPTVALEGMLVASILNKLTTKTTVNTLVHAVRHGAEYIVHTQVATPNELNLELSALQGRIAHVKRQAASAASRPGMAEELAKLAALHQTGALSDDEFAAAKQRILS